MTEKVTRSHGELDERTCRELLARGTVGRVAFCTPQGPQIFPVNYVVDGVSVVFRTAPYGLLGQSWKQRLAFEIDEVDLQTRSGWSVVASGSGRMVEDAEELALLRAFHDPQPWAPGSRLLYVRLVWDTLTGRSVRAGG